MKSARRTLLRGAAAMAIMTALSRVFGLVREQVRGYYLGTSHASDAFGVASMVPNLLRRLFAEGAMTAAFMPVFATYQRRSPAERNAFLSEFFTLLTAMVTAIVVVGIAVTHWLVPLLFPGFASVPGKIELTVWLTRLMWPYLAFISVAAIVQAVLNHFRVFAPSAFTPVLLNVSIIASAVLLHDAFANPATAFAVGFTAGGAAQLLFQLPFLRGRGLRIRLRFRAGPGVRRVLRIFWPGTFAAGIYQVNVLVAQYVASRLPEGSVSSLQYSVRLQELVLGVFAVSLSTAILPILSDHVVAGEHGEARKTFAFAVRAAAFVCIPATAGLLALATPIVQVLYGYGAFGARSVEMTRFAVLFHAVGIFPVAVQRLVAQPFYAMQDLVTPTLVAAGVMVVHAVLCFALAGPLAHGGVALASGLAAALNAGVLWWLLRRRLGPLGSAALAVGLVRIGAAAGLMGLGLAWLVSVWPAPAGRWALAGRTGALVAAGAVAYVAILAVLRAPELGEVARWVRRRADRR